MTVSESRIGGCPLAQPYSVPRIPSSGRSNMSCRYRNLTFSMVLRLRQVTDCDLWTEIKLRVSQRHRFVVRCPTRKRRLYRRPTVLSFSIPILLTTKVRPSPRDSDVFSVGSAGRNWSNYRHPVPATRAPYGHLVYANGGSGSNGGIRQLAEAREFEP